MVSSKGAPLDHEDRELEAQRTSTLSTKGEEIVLLKKGEESGSSQGKRTAETKTPFTAFDYDV